jgi:hypothetical protein
MTHTETISISYQDIKTKILRNLAVLGKRSTDSEGNSTFSKVTVSSKEEPLLSDFVHNAVHNVIAAIPDLVHEFTEDDATASFKVTNTRWKISNGDDFAKAFSLSVVSYCVASAVADYYSMYFGEQSEYYNLKAARMMKDILSLCYFKQPAISEVDPISGCSAEVTNS